MAELKLDVNVDVHGQDKLQGLGRSLAHGGVQLAKFAAVGVGAFAALGGVTSGFASDLNESLSKVDVVFGKNSKAIKDWAKTSSSALGLSEQKALEAAGTFGNLFSAMKIGDKPTKDMSTGLVELAADLASFNNIKPEEALEKLRAGIVGEAEPLRSLGIQISAARTEAKAMELGFKKVDGQLSASAKAQANYALIMEDSVKAQGDFERTSGGMANQQRILAATFDNTMAAIGQAFIPLIQEMLPMVTAGLKSFGEWVTANMPTIKEVISTVLGFIGAGFTFLFTEVIPRAVEIFSALFGAVQSNMPTIQAIVTTVFNAVSGAIDFVTKNVIPPLVQAFTAVVGWVQANWPTISSIFTQVFGAISNAVKTLWPVVSAIATVLFPLVSTAATVLFRALDGTFKLIGGVFEVVGTVVTTVVSTILRLWQILSDMTAKIWEGIVGVIKGVINGIIGLINGFIGFVNGIQIHIPAINVGPVSTPAFDWWGLGLPTIPYLAEGGIVTSPTLAMIGESGPEAVLPLDQALGERHFHSHIEVRGEDPFIRNPDDLIRVQQAIAFLEGFS